MLSSPITSWQIDGEKMETVTDFIYLSSKLTADGDCSHEIKRCLLLEEKLWLTQIQSLGQEDPLEKGMAIPSTILAWKTTVCGVAERWTQLID